VRLAADHRYWWTVRTQDDAGQFGPYAVDAHFDTGLNDADWHASWIRRGGARPTRSDDFSLIRRESTLGASPIVRARLYAAAGQQYDLRVNGTRAAHGPSFSYPDEQYYETTDVTGVVRAGAPNVFAFVTHWSTGGQGRPDSPEALIAHITVDHADGTREVITTDASWRTRAGPWIADTRRNGEGDFVEHIDERLDPIGWDRPGFDDHTWLAATELGTHPWPPFSHLVAARTHIVETSRTPVTLKSLGNAAYVADFGKITSATPVVEIHHGGAGRAVKFVAGDLLDANGHVSATRGTQETDMHWDFTERGGAQELRPFGYLAFRYLEVAGASEPLTAVDVTIAARHAVMPDENAARFHTSDPRVDAVWNLARNSALYDSQEQFLDTPTREKGQFLGDAYDVSQATMAAFGERSMTFEALRDFARSQARYWPDGRVNAVYPNNDANRDIPDYTQDYVQWVWRVWLTTGDHDQLAALYPVVRNITDYLARAIDPKTGLVTNLPGGGGDYEHGMVDWPPQMRYGYDMNTAARTTLNAMAVDDFRRVAAMAEALGKPAAESRREVKRAETLTAAIRKRLERPDGVFVDGLRSDGTQSGHASQQANAFALAFGIAPQSRIEPITDAVVGLGTAMGVMNFRVLLDALHGAGRDDALVAALTDPNRPGYAQILEEGATFTWESWDARRTGDSESHGWGSTVLAVLQDDVLGARVTAPGAAHIEIAVPKTTLTRAAGIVTTQRGPVSIAWTRDAAGRETIDVTIPTNVSATVHIAGSGVGNVEESGRSVVGDPGVTHARGARGEVVLSVGSGHYVFAS
jgi:alpha-L-rhamnosidase